MSRMRSGAIVVVAAIAVVVAACSGGSGGSGAAKTATNAAALGGMEALVAAAKAEGKLNVIALPPEWANYKGVIAAFKAKYALTVDEQQPDANSQEEIDAAKNNAGTDKAPDVFDLGANVALANPTSSRRTRWRRGRTSRPTSRSPRACGSATTPASCRSAAMRTRSPRRRPWRTC